MRDEDKGSHRLSLGSQGRYGHSICHSASGAIRPGVGERFVPEDAEFAILWHPTYQASEGDLSCINGDGL